MSASARRIAAMFPTDGGWAWFRADPDDVSSADAVGDLTKLVDMCEDFPDLAYEPTRVVANDGSLDIIVLSVRSDVLEAGEVLDTVRHEAPITEVIRATLLAMSSVCAVAGAVVVVGEDWRLPAERAVADTTAWTPYVGGDYSVIVGNVGTVYAGPCLALAKREYDAYKALLESGAPTRAANALLLSAGEIVSEYAPLLVPPNVMLRWLEQLYVGCPNTEANELTTLLLQTLTSGVDESQLAALAHALEIDEDLLAAIISG